MRIVFLNPVGVIGGAERVMLTYMNALLNQSEHSIELFLIVGTEGELVIAAEQLGVQVQCLPIPEALSQLGDSAFKENRQKFAIFLLLRKLLKSLYYLNLYQKKLQEIIIKINPDVVHSNGIKTHLIATLANPKNIPLIWQIHDFYGSRPIMAKVLKYFSSQATLGIAISQAVAQDSVQVLPKFPIKTIYNAININHFFPSSSPEHSLRRIGLVATFARWKGQDIFLQAIAQLTQDYPELKADFYIIGGPIYKTQGSQFSQMELEAQAQQLGIAHRVHFLGFQHQMVEIYRWLDIVVHASTQPEPFGLAIIEAMACGKPVIVAQAGGAAELFTHNQDAVGVSPGNPQALAQAIADLLQNPQKCQSLAENARQTVIQRFNDQRLGKQLIEVYYQITQQINSN